MANSFTLPASLTQNLQKIYEQTLYSKDLLGNSADIEDGKNANEIAIPKLAVDGLVDYDRVNGFDKGDVTVTTQTVQVNYDRGRSFGIDAMDEQECGIKAARVLARLEEKHAAPDKDKFTFSKIASGGTTPVAAALSTAADWVAAIRTGANAVTIGGATLSNCILYIELTGKGLIDDADTTKSRKVLEEFGKVVAVPSSVFFTNAQKNSTTNQFEKSSTSKDIHFMIVDPTAVIDYDKYKLSKVVDKDVNTTSDEYIIKYRKVGYVEVYDELKAGVYTHTGA